MKKMLLFACLAATTAWAAQPSQIVRAYNNPQGGYVLVDSNNEILAIADHGSASANDLKLADFLRQNGMTLQVMKEQLPEEIAADAELEVVVPALLDNSKIGAIAYNQGSPYNLMAPMGTDDNGKEARCVTGCVATAMAQILAYWQYPEKCGNGTETYTTSAQQIKVSLCFDTISFDWSKILPKYDKDIASTPEQRMEVARLMLACGVSVHMNYTPNSSGSVSNRVPDALIQYFGYNQALRFEKRNDTSKFKTENDFLQALITEFDNKRPVYCSATYNGNNKTSFDGGHAFVIDGYAYQKGKERKIDRTYFHFNWGWGGTDQIGEYNLWYRLNGSLDKSPYSSDMQIIRNIVPATMTPLLEVAADNKDTRVFDILGHEVTQTIPGQLYISNGKKFIAQ